MTQRIYSVSQVQHGNTLSYVRKAFFSLFLAWLFLPWALQYKPTWNVGHGEFFKRFAGLHAMRRIYLKTVGGVNKRKRFVQNCW